MKLKWLCISFSFVVIAHNTIYGEDNLSISQLKEIILQKENDFKNLYVEGSHKVEVWDKDKKEFVLSNSSDIEGWLLNEPDKRYRFNVKNETCRWEGGPQPYSNDKYDKAFNGKITQTLTKRTGNMDEDVLSGEIDSKRSPIHGIGNFATGWGMSIYGIYNAQKRALSELFDAPNRECTIHEANFEGQDCIKLTASYKGDVIYSEEIYLDPEKGYALIGYENFIDGKILKKIIAEKFIKTTSGIFYPSQAKCNTYDRNENILYRVSYLAKEVFVNSPTFTNDIFTIKWPAGITVYDHVTDISFVIGPTDEEFFETVEQQINQVENIKSEKSNNNSDNTSVSNQVGNDNDLSSNEKDITQKSSIGITLLSIGSLFTFLCIIIWFAKKRSKKYISILIFCLLPSLAYAQTYSVGIQELKDNKVYNCGLMSTAYILMKNRVDYNMDSLVSALDVGQKWEKPTSLLNIKNLLIDKGFSVAAYKDMKGEDIIKTHTKKNVCLVNINKNGQGHYLIIESLNGKEVVCVDPGIEVKVFSNDEFKERIDSVTTGFGLFIDRYHAMKYHSLKQDEIIVDIGELALGQGELVINVPVKNDTGEDFKVLNVKGECSCFLGFTIEESESDIIEKGGLYKLVFKFYRSAFQPGEFKSKVLLIGDKPDAKNLLFSIRGKGIGRVAERINFHPEKLRLSSNASQEEHFVLFLPRSIELIEYKSNSENILLRKVRTIDNVNNSNRKLIEFKISIVNNVDLIDDVPKFLEFKISDRQTPIIKIPCLTNVE